MKISVFRDCKILKNHKFITEDLWVRDGKIINPEKVFFDEKQEPNVEIFCNGALISPGLLDIQINGEHHRFPFEGKSYKIFINIL
jgi:N-acetylglucosamine-6-phosphate deacetylase